MKKTEITKKLINLKDQIIKNKNEEQQLIGEKKSLEKQLKDDFNLTIEKCNEAITTLNKEISKLEVNAKKLLVLLEEKLSD